MEKSFMISSSVYLPLLPNFQYATLANEDCLLRCTVVFVRAHFTILLSTAHTALDKSANIHTSNRKATCLGPTTHSFIT